MESDFDELPSGLSFRVEDSRVESIHSGLPGGGEFVGWA